MITKRDDFLSADRAYMSEINLQRQLQRLLIHSSVAPALHAQPTASEHWRHTRKIITTLMNIICAGLGFLVVLEQCIMMLCWTASITRCPTLSIMLTLLVCIILRQVIILVLCVKMFSVSLPVLLCRVFVAVFITVFSSVISVHSLSVCLSVFSILCWLPCWWINVSIINETIHFFLNCNQHFGNFKPKQFPSAVW